jgi:hypothetical protein
MRRIAISLRSVNSANADSSCDVEVSNQNGRHKLDQLGWKSERRGDDDER